MGRAREVWQHRDPNMAKAEREVGTGRRRGAEEAVWAADCSRWEWWQQPGLVWEPLQLPVVTSSKRKTCCLVQEENSSREGRWWEWGSRIKENMNLDRTVETRDTPCLAKGSHQPHSWRMADRRRRGRLSASWMESKVSPSGGRMRRCCV